ncbi:NAD-binding protein [Hydrogenimonas sp.]
MKNLFIKYLVTFSYYLESAPGYQRVKKFFYDLLNNDDYPYKKYFDLFMIFIILSSVAILVVDVRERVAWWLDYYDLYIVTTIFIIEYLLRLWVCSDMHKVIIAEFEESEFFEKPFSLSKVFKEIAAQKWQYITSLPAIIDLIAILPSYRELRILRVFVLFRAFKMLRYSKSLIQFFEILKSKRIELYTLLTLLAFFTLIASVMIYVFEGNGTNPNIHSLFDAAYWALVTITTVGYGDIAPVSTEGRTVSMLIILTGIGAISFLTSIIVSAFNEKLPEIKQTRVMNLVMKKRDLNLVCGYGKIGQLVAKKLKESGESLLVIESDPSKVEMAELDGLDVLRADATKSGTLLKLKLCDRVKSVICATHDDIVNVFITINARSLCKKVQIIARCSDKSVAKKLRLAGADHLIMPEEIAGLLGAVYIGQPVAFDALQAILTQKKSARIDEVEVRLGSFLDGAKVGDFDFAANRLILLAVLKKLSSKEKSSHYVVFNPPDDITLKAGDILVVMGYSVSIADFKGKVEHSVRYKTTVS